MEKILAFSQTLWHQHPGLAVLLTLLAGWLWAYLMKVCLAKGLKLLQFEKFSARIGFTEFLRKGYAKYTATELIGVIAYWVILAATLLHLAKALDITIINALSKRLAAAAPGFIAAVLMTVVGIILVSFLATVVMTLARNAGVPNAPLILKVLKFIGVIIVLAIALDQIGIGRTFLAPMVLMLFGAIMLALALAFGLGCRDLAKNAMEKFIQELKNREGNVKGTDLEG